ncbi:calcium homeostasis endoplasmic reticulum protein [Toxorhynchites rutilus septentrionalis]|uniref:calcium homeostasis endoplasmic reticulum protein n=1 Tax=Toxorhynchites rutilus septentrionalis TaxID=329112 RepID=UPI002478EED5|nr:calcium homeostasis endoplasmic reticulum protein [Toxorhynchites rutilus septentrionalis]
MDIPLPPNDIELKNIIDKLAEFVARNGPEFESMTKTKQKGNSKFAFLYGGEYYNYYQYKVLSKQQSMMKQQGGHLPALMGQQMNAFNTHQPVQQTQQPSQNNQIPQIWSNPPPAQAAQPQQPVISAQISAQIETIATQQSTLREQIRQSELNLQAQHGVLLQQQQAQIDEAVIRAQNDALVKQADEHKISLSDFDTKLQPIIDSCTKDSISNGKGWILQHCTDSGKCQIISQYLLKKALIAGVLFTQKLHLIYLVNDVIHHCIRKRTDELKKCLESVVIPMFCNAQITASNEEQRAKLAKLLSLWESKGNFFDACVISKLKSPPSSLQEYQNTLLTQYSAIVAQITQATKVTFDNYQQQHQAFVQHATQQLTLLENQKQQIEQQAIKAALAAQQKNAGPPPLLPELSGGSNNGIGQLNPLLNNNSRGNDRDAPIPSLLDQNINFNLLSGAIQNLQNLSSQGSQNNRGSDNGSSNVGGDNRSGSYSHSNDSGEGNNNNNNNNGDYSLPPPNFPIPDMSRPPPSVHQFPFNNSNNNNRDNEGTDERRTDYDEQPPNDDDRENDPETQPEYTQDQRSQSPQELTPTIPYFELPAGLMVPLIRLEDFNYHPLDPGQIRLPPPTPQNERLLSAVEAFYAPPSHERPRDGEGWEKLALYEYFKVKNASRKQKEEEIEKGVRDRSQSPDPVEQELLKITKKTKKRVYRSRSRSRSKSRSRERSRSRSPRHRNRSRSRSRSQSRSPRRGRGRSRSPRRERDRSRERRSPTPPSFGGSGFGSKPNTAFMEDKMPAVAKLGGGLFQSVGNVSGEVWAGNEREGLGSYGARNDPYESFRKNKGAAFITRLKAKSDDR